MESFVTVNLKFHRETGSIPGSREQSFPIVAVGLPTASIAYSRAILLLKKQNLPFSCCKERLRDYYYLLHNRPRDYVASTMGSSPDPDIPSKHWCHIVFFNLSVAASERAGI